MTDDQRRRLGALLRDVKRSGGADRWSHLSSHGHNFSTVRAAVARGYLVAVDGAAYHWRLSDVGVAATSE